MSFTNRQGSIEFIDGTPTTYFSCGTNDLGDASIGNLQQAAADAIALINRGGYKGRVKGADAPISFSFSYRPPIETFTKSDADRILDVIMWSGNQASGLVSTNPISTGPKTCSIKLAYTDGAITASITLTHCHTVASIDESGDSLIVKIEVESYGTPTLA